MRSSFASFLRRQPLAHVRAPISTRLPLTVLPRTARSVPLTRTRTPLGRFFSAAPVAEGRQPQPTDKLAIMFTCGNCEARCAKQFSRSSYEQGVVLCKCPSCEKYHVIADHKGWFGGKGNIEDIMKEKGEQVKSVTPGQWEEFVNGEGDLILSAEDIAGGKLEFTEEDTKAD